MKVIILIVILAMTFLMIPFGKAELIVTARSSDHHHIPEVRPGNSTSSQPYVAGWMDAGGEHFGVTQTRVTVSFPNTDPSVIQEDNWLAGGMFVTGFDTALDQTDYGFYTVLTLLHDGSLSLDVGVWQTYEGIPGILNPPWAELLYSATWEIGGVSPSTPITLTARWDVSSGLIYWEFTVSGSTFSLSPFNITAVAPTIQRQFIVGTIDLWQTCPICLWALPYMFAYDFQFGIMSNYNIGHSGWNVKLEYPQYYKEDSWHIVDSAKSIGGENAFLDARWVWGGENYDGVNTVNPPDSVRYFVTFHYTGSTLEDWVRLWSPPPGGGYCPFAYIWNGTQYVIDNNLLPTSEGSNGTDVEDYYKLEQSPVPRDGKYSLLISEFETEHSYFDQVRLLAVDHDSDVNIAVTPNGEILTFKDPLAPIASVDNNGIDRLNQILQMDGNTSDPATYFYGEMGEYLTLNFGQVNSDDAKLILRDDMKCGEFCSIEVQVKNSNNEWQTIDVVSPRAYWSIEAVDLSPYVVGGRDFTVRLFWTEPHRVDYVGLDTSEQEDYDLREGNLVSAIHSTQGDVKNLLKKSDNDYAELVPDQQIQIEFTLPDNSKQARTYILHTEGHYYTIQA